MSNRNRFEVMVPDQLAPYTTPEFTFALVITLDTDLSLQPVRAARQWLLNSSSVTGGSQYLAKSTAIENLEPAGRGRNIGPTQPAT